APASDLRRAGPRCRRCSVSTRAEAIHLRSAFAESRRQPRVQSAALVLVVFAWSPPTPPDCSTIEYSRRRTVRRAGAAVALNPAETPASPPRALRRGRAPHGGRRGGP